MSLGNISVVELVVNRISLLLCRCIKTDDIIKKFEKTIPLFLSYDILQTDVLGSGTYGTVRRGYIKSIQLKVAIKSFSESSKNLHILAEGLIYSEMSGNPDFSFFYCMIKSRFLLIGCIDNSTTLRKSLEKKVFYIKVGIHLFRHSKNWSLLTSKRNFT